MAGSSSTNFIYSYKFTMNPTWAKEGSAITLEIKENNPVSMTDEDFLTPDILTKGR